jgi:YegS/Rv2252/BmrU family lipid kinase
MMKTAHVLFNPASGSFSNKRAERILTALRDAGIDPRPLLPASEADAISQVKDLCRDNDQPLIIAVGGDGTINTVINGMTEKSAVLGIIPLGTANVLALELGIRSIGDAVKRIAVGTVRDFSVGEVKAARGIRRFMLMAGIGIDGAVVADVRSGEKRYLGRLAYLLSALRMLCKWDQTQQTVSDSQHSAECHSVVVANAANYGGPFCLAPQAGIFMPHLQVIPLALSTRFSLIRLALSMLQIRKKPMLGTWLHNTGELHVAGTKAIQIDGDSFGTGPMTVRSIPAFNRIVC